MCVCASECHKTPESSVSTLRHRFRDSSIYTVDQLSHAACGTKLRGDSSHSGTRNPLLRPQARDSTSLQTPMGERSSDRHKHSHSSTLFCVSKAKSQCHKMETQNLQVALPIRSLAQFNVFAFEFSCALTGIGKKCSNSWGEG